MFSPGGSSVVERVRTTCLFPKRQEDVASRKHHERRTDGERPLLAGTQKHMAPPPRGPYVRTHRAFVSRPTGKSLPSELEVARNVQHVCREASG